MRVLLDDPHQLTPAAYRRFTRRAQIEGLFLDLLVRGSPYLALNAVVLTREEGEVLRRATEELSAALHDAGLRLARDVPALVGLGFPWAAAELLAAETPRLPVVGRFDFMQDGDGRWWMLEFNADTPSGTPEGVVIDRLVHQALGCIEGRPTEVLGQMLVDAFRTPGAIGLVTSAGEPEDLAQMAFTQRLLSQAGMDVVLGDIDNLRVRRGHAYMLGRRIDALYRLAAFETMFGTPAFAAIYDAVLSGNLELLNGLYGLLLQNKGLLAYVDHEHLAPTWRLDDLPGELRPADLVAKQFFGRSGQEVFFGDALNPEAWSTLKTRGTYVAQRRVRPVPMRALMPTSEGFEVQEGYATVGCFAVNGRFAGYYTRFGEPITDDRAKWVATFEESGS